MAIIECDGVVVDTVSCDTVVIIACLDIGSDINDEAIDSIDGAVDITCDDTVTVDTIEPDDRAVGIIEYDSVSVGIIGIEADSDTEAVDDSVIVNSFEGVVVIVVAMEDTELVPVSIVGSIALLCLLDTVIVNLRLVSLNSVKVVVDMGCGSIAVELFK